MSSALILRAVEKLREHANAATPGPWKTGGGDFRPWELVITPDLPIVEFANDHDGASTAEYIALVHPPVALALAATMEKIAWMGGLDPDQLHRVGCQELIDVAREILREPQ